MLCFGSCCLAKITPRHADYCLRGAGVPPPCWPVVVLACCRVRQPPCLRRRSGRPVRRMPLFTVSVRAVSAAVSAPPFGPSGAQDAAVYRIRPRRVCRRVCAAVRAVRCAGCRRLPAIRPAARPGGECGLFPDGAFSGRGCFRAGRLRSRRRARGGLPSPQDQLHGAGHFAARGKLDAKHPFTGNGLPVPGGGGPAWRLGHRFEDASFEAVVGRFELG